MPGTTRNVTATLNYNANEGSNAPSSQTVTRHGVQTSNGYYLYIAVSEDKPERDNYNFVGWGSSSSATEVKKLPGDTYAFYFPPANSDQSMSATLYAIWELKTYSVSFNANGGEGAPEAQTKIYGTDLVLSSVEPTRENYMFQGWSTSPNGPVEYVSGATYTANADIVLYAVWQVAAAVLTSVSDVTIGLSGTASWTKISEDHTYRLMLVFGTNTINVAGILAGSSSVSFAIPSTWLSALPNSSSGVATATLYSYLNGELVGSTSKTFHIFVNASVRPVISSFTASPHSDNSAIEAWGVAVQGYSYLTLAVNASAGTGASISSIEFSGIGIFQNSLETTGDTAILTDVGTLQYNVKVTDSRGRVNTAIVNAICYEYASPVVSSLQAVRCLANGTESNVEGNYIKAYPVFSFSSVNGNNSLAVKKIEYKQDDLTIWNVGIASAVSGSWSSPFGVADISRTFNVRCTITDAVGNTYTLETVVLSVVGFAIGLKNDRARFGGPVIKEGLQVDWETEFNDDVYLNGNLFYNRRYANGSISQSGWYRVLTFASDDVNSVFGSEPVLIGMAIVREGLSADLYKNEFHKIDLLMAYLGIYFVNELSDASLTTIDKVRYMTNLTLQEGYIDIHYNSSTQRNVAISFDVKGLNDTQDKIGSTNFVPVGDAPSGEVLHIEHTFLDSGATLFNKVIGKSLWTGTFAEVDDEITVPGIHDYYLFKVRTATKDTHSEESAPIIAMLAANGEGIVGTNLGANGYSYYNFFATISGNVLTFHTCNRRVLAGGAGIPAALEVIEIIGII